MGIVGTRPFTYDNGASEGVKMADSWFRTEEEFVGGGWNVGIFTSKALDRQNIEDVSTISKGVVPKRVR
jgi:hypothetical protein